MMNIPFLLFLGLFAWLVYSLFMHPLWGSEDRPDDFRNRPDRFPAGKPVTGIDDQDMFVPGTVRTPTAKRR